MRFLARGRPRPTPETGTAPVILDIRHNLGGNDSTSTIRTFQDPAIDQSGRLFVITSSNTFSAALFIADELDQFSAATLVGEPIGGAPGGPGGEMNISLDGLPIPLVVDIPRGRVGGSSNRLTVEPDISVPLTGRDYFDGIDRAMEAIHASGT